MAQKQVIDANLMYKIGVASKADPKAKLEYEERMAKKERMRNYLLAAGKLAVNYWMQTQSYGAKLQEQSSPLVTELTLATRKAELMDNLKVQDSIKNIESNLYDATKTMKRYMMFPNGEKYMAAEQQRNIALTHIKKLTESTDKLAALEDTYSGYFSNLDNKPQSDASFSEAFSANLNSPPAILAHNSQEKIRNAALVASGAWRDHAYIDPETNEYMIRLDMNGQTVDMTMAEFSSNLATPGDTKINELATKGIDELLSGKTNTPYSLHSDWYETKVRDIFNNPSLVNETSYKTWLFQGTYYDKDGNVTTPAEAIAQEWMRKNEVGFGGENQPGPVDMPGTPGVDETELTLQYNDKLLSYAGVLDEMREMRYVDENSRKPGMELYLDMLQTRHNKLYNYAAEKARLTVNKDPKKPKNVRINRQSFPYSDIKQTIDAIESGQDFGAVQTSHFHDRYAAIRRVDGVYELWDKELEEWDPVDNLNRAILNLDIGHLTSSIIELPEGDVDTSTLKVGQKYKRGGKIYKWTEQGFTQE